MKDSEYPFEDTLMCTWVDGERVQCLRKAPRTAQEAFPGDRGTYACSLTRSAPPAPFWCLPTVLAIGMLCALFALVVISAHLT